MATGETKGKTVVETKVVSAPGARVVETRFTFSPEVRKQLQIRAEVPTPKK